MRNEKTNELIEIAKESDQKNEVNEAALMIGEKMVEGIMSLGSTVIGLSRELAENREAKYKAYADTVITKVEADNEEELKDIENFHEAIMKDENRCDEILNKTWKRIEELEERLLVETDETKRKEIKEQIKNWDSRAQRGLYSNLGLIGKHYDQRLENSQRRRKGFFDFLRGIQGKNI